MSILLTGRELCKALDLDPAKVGRIVITAEPNHVLVEVTHLVMIEDKRLVETVKQYTLVEKTE